MTPQEATPTERAIRAIRRLDKDRLSGVLLLVVGLAIAAQGSTYRIGSLTRMHAGFVPVCLGVLIAVTGIAIWLTADRARTSDSEGPPISTRGGVCILGSIAAFVVLGTYGGLVPATFFTVLIAALGDRANRVRDGLVLAAVITVVGTVIFAYGLKMTFPLFTWG